MHSFAALEVQLEDTLRDIALEMKSGNAAACGITDDTNPCAYCKLRQLCRVGVPAPDDDENSDEEYE